MTKVGAISNGFPHIFMWLNDYHIPSNKDRRW